jgi:hypothetical protein
MKAEYIEECHYAGDINRDVKNIFEKWMKRYGWDIPELDEKVAAELIITEMKKSIQELEEKHCGKECDRTPLCPAD